MQYAMAQVNALAKMGTKKTRTTKPVYKVKSFIHF